MYTKSHTKLKVRKAIKSKNKIFWGPFILFYLCSTNIKIVLNEFLDSFWTALNLLFFFFVPNWVSTIKYGALNRKTIYSNCLYSLKFFMCNKTTATHYILKLALVNIGLYSFFLQFMDPSKSLNK